MVYSTGRAAADSRRRGGSVCTWWNQSQKVHTEPPLLLESTAALPVLYTISVVGFVLFSWWWARCPKHVETPINTSSFLHLVGYLFTFIMTVIDMGLNLRCFSSLCFHCHLWKTPRWKWITECARGILPFVRECGVFSIAMVPCVAMPHFASNFNCCGRGCNCQFNSIIC
jgi:hypothetical protein